MKRYHHPDTCSLFQKAMCTTLRLVLYVTLTYILLLFIELLIYVLHSAISEENTRVDA